MSTEQVTIILADDDDGHATLVERNFERGGFVSQFVRVRDGQEVIDLLRGEGSYTGKPLKGYLLLLLDIKMPRLDGIEVLRIIKDAPEFARIPVIMLTTTDDPREVEKSYLFGCSAYIVKPLNYQSFIEVIRRLGLFLQLVIIPPSL